MQKSLDVYKFATKNLKDTIESVVDCQKEVIDYYQEKINKIKENNSYTEKEKTEKIQEFLSSINEVHSILRKNNNIINSMLDSVKELENNLSIMENTNISESSSANLEDKTKELINVIRNACDRIYSISEEAHDMLQNEENSDDENSGIIIENELQKMFRLSKETSEILSGIKISEVETNNKTINKINDYLSYELDRTNYISEEASKLLDMDKNEVLNNNLLDNFIESLKVETKNIKNRIVELEELSLNESDRTETVAITLLQNILEDEYQKIVSSIYKLEKATGKETKREEISFDKNKEVNDKHNMEAVLSKQAEILEDSNDEITNYLLELKNGNYSSREIVQKLRTMYNRQIENLETISLENEELLENNVVDKEQKIKDDEEYKKYSSVLNESFWNSRQRASEEGIKYPSSLYENKVKEYQNEYLTEKYSVSLDDVETYIEKYKEKYAEDIYKDKIYEDALYQLRRETNKSVQELCKETENLSLLDQKAKQLIENDLIDIIREVGIEKNKTDDNNSTFNDYRKNMSLKKLIDKKEIIEHQLSIIRLREKRIKENI